MRPTGKITQQIFEAMQAGDREAFDHFFERHSARVLVYINYNMSGRLRRKLDPADVLQELYLKILDNFDSFCEKVERRGIQSVLIRMADHEISEAYRYHFKVDKRDARRELTAGYLNLKDSGFPDPLDWVPSDATSVTARVVRNDDYRRVMRMLSQLTPIEQFVTVARVIEGLRTREIAEQLGKSRGAVQMIVARVLEKLRKRAAVPPRKASGSTEQE